METKDCNKKIDCYICHKKIDYSSIMYSHDYKKSRFIIKYDNNYKKKIIKGKDIRYFCSDECNWDYRFMLYEELCILDMLFEHFDLDDALKRLGELESKIESIKESQKKSLDSFRRAPDSEKKEYIDILKNSPNEYIYAKCICKGSLDEQRYTYNFDGYYYTVHFDLYYIPKNDFTFDMYKESMVYKYSMIPRYLCFIKEDINDYIKKEEEIKEKEKKYYEKRNIKPPKKNNKPKNRNFKRIDEDSIEFRDD